MIQQSSSTIFENIRNGDETAFNALFDQHYTALCFFASKYLNDMDLSRSLVQELFVNLWEKREKLNIKQSVKSYLYTAVKNRAIDFLRSVKEKEPLSENIDNWQQTPFHDLIEESELNERINKSINTLPSKCREVFVLCRFEEMKYLEIAKELGISIKTVEMHMSHALKKIRSDLSDYQMINLLIFVKTKKS